MKKTSHKVVIAALVIAGFLSLRLYAPAPKKPAAQVWTPGCVASVPESRGGIELAANGIVFTLKVWTLSFPEDFTKLRSEAEK